MRSSNLLRHLFLMSSFGSLTFILGACGAARQHASIDISDPTEAWNANNDPLHLADTYETQLATLPLNGSASQAPWTDTYWPSYRGGLAQRWNSPQHTDGFSYAILTQEQVALMSQDELAQLSPAEKYDIYRGRYDFPLLRSERVRTHPDDETWFGLCHGWAPASIAFTEPKPVVIESEAAIKIPFGSSDIKGLLLYMQQYQREYYSTRFLGERCNVVVDGSDNDSNPECRDVNAGSFHIILANFIGLQQRAFVADVQRDRQVWNQPIFGFSSRVVNSNAPIYSGAAPGTVGVVQMATEVQYISEMGPYWQALPLESYPQQVSVMRLEYTLELNAAGQIIGGEWMQYQRPDFLWTQSAGAFPPPFTELKAIYEAAIQ